MIRAYFAKRPKEAERRAWPGSWGDHLDGGAGRPGGIIP